MVSRIYKNMKIKFTTYKNNPIYIVKNGDKIGLETTFYCTTHKIEETYNSYVYGAENINIIDQIKLIGQAFEALKSNLDDLNHNK